MSDDFEDEKPQSSDEFARMLDASFKQSQKKLSVGDKIKGEILVLGKEDVFVSTGTMNDGQVPRKDLLNEKGEVPYKVGDTIELYVTLVKGTEIHLSPKKTAKNLADDLEDAFDMMLPVEGRVVEVLPKGGFRVSLMGGKLAFCPISQMDTRRIETGEEYVGKRFEFRITQLSEGGRNIVVSRRALLDEQREETAGNFLADNKAGAVVSGKIARLEKFGAFIELAPGVDGLAHVSELSWSRVADPAEVVAVGQDVRVKILKIETDDRGRPRISLSIKQAEGEPWDRMPEGVQPGQTVQGKVTKCMKFGAFVELAPGIEGLIPMGELSYTQRVMRAEDVVKEGETVTVRVVSVDPGTRRISLSLRDAGTDPWSMVSQNFPVGKIISGKIERKEPYGLFVKLDDGIVGLLPKSKANEHPEFPFEKLRVGDTTSVQVAEIRLDERRISLDVPKDPGSDDWKEHVSASSGASGFATLGDKLRAAMEKKKK